MKNSTVHAKEVKTFFNRLKRSGPKPTTYDSSDYLQQFVFTVLSEGNSLSKAKSATTRLMKSSWEGQGQMNTMTSPRSGLAKSMSRIEVNGIRMP